MCLCGQSPCTCGGNYGIGGPFASPFGDPRAASNASIGAYYAAQQAVAAQQSAYHNALANSAGLSSLAGGLGQMGGPSPHHFTALPTNMEPLAKAGTTFGEFIGWRMWGIRDGYLQSYSAQYVWTPGIAAEGKPDDYGGGGLWAFKDPGKALHKLLENGTPAAMGSVWLYGDVIEHSDGYRGQYAMVRSIDRIHLPRKDNHRWWELLKKGDEPEILAALCERYHVALKLS